MENILKFLDFLALVTWLGGGNLVLYKSIKRQDLPMSYYFAPFSVLKGKDWLKLLGLVVITFH